MVLIVGATPYSQWQQTQPLLAQAGLALTESRQLEDWYNQALSSPEHAMIERPITPDAELTTQARAMLDSAPTNTLWGVNNPDNVWLLEFWAQKSAANRFLLFYTRPETAVVQAMQQGVDPIEALQHWQNNTQQLLAFYRRNRRKALLVDVSHALENPEFFVESCANTFSLEVNAAELPTLTTQHPSPLLQLIAEQLIAQGPKLSSLLAELEASSTALATDPQLCSEYDFSVLFQEYQLSGIQVSTLAEAQAAQAQQQAELAKLAAHAATLESSQQDTVQENELLLLQLHQVQEELEATFLTAQTAEQKANNEKVALNRQLTEALSGQSQQHTSASSELSALQSKLSALETSHQDTEQENELLLLQLHQVQEELEHYFLQYQSLEEKVSQAESTRHVTESLALDRKLSKPSKISKQKIKPLFHSTWYQKQAGKRTLPLAHYLKHGWKQQLSPHPLFDPQFYIEKHRLEDLQYCPLTHFIDVGHTLGYSPHPLFDSQWYLAEYPDVKESGTNPLLHYLACGANEGRNPSNAFHTDWYLATYPDVRESGINPLLHFALFGEADKRKQNPYQ